MLIAHIIFFLITEGSILVFSNWHKYLSIKTWSQIQGLHKIFVNVLMVDQGKLKYLKGHQNSAIIVRRLVLMLLVI